ncbi:MAG: hypothetical protein KTR21_02065 [Rhodobacteraceae bacterium]|nr:hypothetical protein [Paracoccaceae bacterium]
MRHHCFRKILAPLVLAGLFSAADALAQTSPGPTLELSPELSPGPAPEPAPDANTAPEAPPTSPSLQPTSQETLSFNEFRKLSDGKTLHFHLPDGTPWGREYYIPGSQDSIFIFHDGECFEGYWTYDGQHYCYHYQSEPSCWVHFWRQGQLTVESRGGHRQVVVAIRDREPLSCKPDLLSSMPSPNG